MTAKDLANRLDGRQYLEEMTQEEERLAKENGLVVVFGYSDDNIELRGAIYDEAGCFDGGSFFVRKNGAVCAAGYESKDVIKIDAIWCGASGANWEYETKVPHETFNIYEEDELFCIGIVFSMKEAFGA